MLRRAGHEGLRQPELGEGNLALIAGLERVQRIAHLEIGRRVHPLDLGGRKQPGAHEPGARRGLHADHLDVAAAGEREISGDEDGVGEGQHLGPHLTGDDHRPQEVRRDVCAGQERGDDDREDGAADHGGTGRQRQQRLVRPLCGRGGVACGRHCVIVL